MKKRRTLIISLLLVAAIVLGVGYALDTSTLTINGSAHVTPDQANLKVEFTAVDDEDGINYATGSLGAIPTEATIDATGFTTAGQKETVTYTITNNGEYDAMIKLNHVLPNHSSGEPFHVTETFKEIDGATPLTKDTEGNYILKKGESILAEVTVELEVTPIEFVESEIKITVVATALHTVG